jgi:hypothetical protein
LRNLYCFLLTSNDQNLAPKLDDEKTDLSFGEIEKIGICKKIRFLKKYSLNKRAFEVLDRKKENELRNDIAHFDFLVAEKGGIEPHGDEVGGKRKEKDVFRIYEKLLDFINKIFPPMWKCLEKYDLYPYDDQDLD